MPVYGSDCGSQPPVTLFAGMSRAQLLAALGTLQQAYIDLMAGNKGESFTYTQGDGSKSVVYTRAQIGNLSQVIAELQQLLGMSCRARRPIKFTYR